MNIGSLFKNLTNFQFPYSIGSTPYYSTPLWDLYEGTRKRDSYPVTIFKGKIVPNGSGMGSEVNELILHAAHMSKVIRVPGVCPVLDVFDETGSDDIFVITEVVQPLQPQLNSHNINSQGIMLGLSDLFRLFEIIDPLFIMGNLSTSNIYVDKNGSWVMFGLECCFDKAKNKFDPYKFKDYVRVWNQFCNDGTARGGEELEPTMIDNILLGQLITQLFTLAQVNVPRNWKSLITSITQGKLSMKGFISKMKQTSNWQQDEMMSIYEELKELNIKTDKDKLLLMKRFENHYISCPDKQQFQGLTNGFINNLIIPEITSTLKWITSVENGLQTYNNSLVKLLTILLDLIIHQDIKIENGFKLNNEIKELIYLTFKFSDRQIRFILLIYLPKLLTLFPNKTFDFSNRIFNFFLQGMLDTDKSLRLQTLKTIPYILDEITERQLNNEILRSIAKTQVDPEEAIRTWTILIIVKISNRLTGISNRDNVLATIYTKSLKDPNIKTKLAALYGLKMSVDIFHVDVIANKVMSVIAPGLLDKDRIIRVKAKELFNIYLKKLETEADSQFADDSRGNNEDDKEIREYVKEFESYEREDVDQNMDGIINNFMQGLSLHMNSQDDLLSYQDEYTTASTTPAPVSFSGQTQRTQLNNHSTVDDWDRGTPEQVDDGWDNGDDGWGKEDDITDDFDNAWDEDIVEKEQIRKSSILNKPRTAPAKKSILGGAVHTHPPKKTSSILDGHQLKTKPVVKKSILTKYKSSSAAGSILSKNKPAIKKPVAPTPKDEQEPQEDAWDDEW
ncbi:cytoplasmic export protein 1 [Monosporozyma unispora]